MRRRNDIAVAQLQDKNVTLKETAHRQQATIDAHLRFSARASVARSTMSTDLQHTQEKLMNLDRQTQSELSQNKIELQRMRNQIKELEDANRALSQSQTTEMSTIYMEWEKERSTFEKTLLEKTQQLDKAFAEQVRVTVVDSAVGRGGGGGLDPPAPTSRCWGGRG